MLRSIRRKPREMGKRKSPRTNHHHGRRMLFEGLEQRQMMDGGLAAYASGDEAFTEDDVVPITASANLPSPSVSAVESSSDYRWLAGEELLVEPEYFIWPGTVSQAAPDDFLVDRNTFDNVLRVLDNDWGIAPMTIRQLREGSKRVSEVGPTTQGGVVTIAQDGRTLRYTPSPDFEGVDTFTYTTVFGLSATVAVSVEKITDLVRIRLETTNDAGTPIHSIDVGETFILNIYVEDLRDVPRGVFAAYLDVTFDATLATVHGPFGYHGPYQNGRLGTTRMPGLIDELGAFAGLSEPGDGEFRIVSVPLTATNVGQITFTSSEAAGVGHDVLLYGNNYSVHPGALDFGAAVLDVVNSEQARFESTDGNHDGDAATSTSAGRTERGLVPGERSRAADVSQLVFGDMLPVAAAAEIPIGFWEDWESQSPDSRQSPEARLGFSAASSGSSNLAKARQLSRSDGSAILEGVLAEVAADVDQAWELLSSPDSSASFFDPFA